MIRIAIIGDIGSGKSHVAKQFGYPVFNADTEVAKLYKKNRKFYGKLKKKLPAYITSFPVQKSKVSEAIIDNKNNLNKIIKIVHPTIRIKMRSFIKKHRNKKFDILDIPLLIENKINKKNDIVIFVEAKKDEIRKRLKKRSKINPEIINKFKKIQLSIELKKRKSNYIIKNNFKNNSIKKSVKKLLKEITLKCSK